MAKNYKKEKQIREQNKGLKDKDIHLNVIGVPTKNVNVNKTSAKQNSEEYHLYKINIDTKNKEQDRKHRIGSLEPVDGKNKKHKRYNNTGDLVSSSDSDSVLSRSSRSKALAGSGRVRRATTSKPKKKGNEDDEICFTIPGEKGKAIKIVGSSTKPRDDLKPQESQLRDPNVRKSGPPRQVGFANEDEVYGTTPEHSSLGSYEPLPYKRTTPQVYKAENPTPESLFKNLNGPIVSSPKPENQRELNGKTPDRTKGDTAQFSSSGALEDGRPSTSQGGSNYDSPTDKTVDGKGKYPFYPYDKQKGSRSPSAQLQEPQSTNQQDDKSLRSEPLPFKKLPSIPEVLSSTEYIQPQHDLEPRGPSLPVNQSSGLKGPTTKLNIIDEHISPISSKIKNSEMPPSNSLKPETEPLLSEELFYQGNMYEIPKTIKSQKPSFENVTSKSTLPMQLLVQETNDQNKQSYTVPQKAQKELNLNDTPLSQEKLKPNQLGIQKPIKSQKPSFENVTSKSTLPTQLIVQEANDPNKQIYPIPQRTQRELNLNDTPLSQGKLKPNQLEIQKPIKSQKSSFENVTSKSTLPTQLIVQEANDPNKQTYPIPQRTQRELNLNDTPLSQGKLKPNQLEIQKPIKSQKPSFENVTSKSTLPMQQIIVQEVNDQNKQTYPIPQKTQRELSLSDTPLSQGKLKPNQLEKSPQQNVVGKPKVENKLASPAMKNDIQRPLSSTGSPDSNKYDKQKSPQGITLESKSRTTHPKQIPFKKPNYEILEESLSSKLNPQDNKTPDQNKYKSVKEPIVNKKSSSSKSPVMASKEVMTEKPLNLKNNTLSDKKSEFSKKSIPTYKQLDKDFPKEKSTEIEKDSKKSKSRLSTFVSSIPKPLFRRNKSLEKKSTDKALTPEKTPLKLNSLEKQLAMANQKPNVENKTKMPVTESPLMKKDYEPVKSAYPGWVFSSEQKMPENHKNEQPSKGSLTRLTVSNYTLKDDQTSNSKHGQTSNYNQQKQFLPFGVHDSPSVEIANRHFDGVSLPEEASKTKSYPSWNNTIPQRSGIETSEKTDQAVAISQNESQTSYRDKNDKLKGKPSEGLSHLAAEDNRQHQSNHDIEENVLGEIPSGFEYGKNKMMFDGFNVVAYPGRINEQTPFGFDSQFKKDPIEENEAIASLKNAYENQANPDGFDSRLFKKDPIQENEAIISLKNAYVNQEKPESGNIGPVQYPRDKTESPTPSSSRSKEMGYVHSFDVEPSNYPIESQLFPEKHILKEAKYNPNKKTTYKDTIFGHQNVPDNEKKEAKGSPGGLGRNNDEGGRRKSADGKGFGKKPEEQMVYAVNNPETTHEVFQSPGFNKEQDGQLRKTTPTTESLGPKGILIFVNKKNEAASPFQKTDKKRPVRLGKSKPKPAKTTKPIGSKDKQNKANSSKPSEDSYTVTSLGSSSAYSGGDKIVQAAKSPSGNKVTQKYPCGCKKITTSGPKEQQRAIELISVNCKEGSECEVRKGHMLSQAGLSSGEGSYRGSPGRLFPDIEVLADGVVSRRPIKPKTPAPKMNGANFTGTLNIKSDKFNGVCNFYLDKKLKNYLRNNIDNLKLLLDDDYKR